MRLPAACQDLEMIIGSPHPQVRSGQVFTFGGDLRERALVAGLATR